MAAKKHPNVSFIGAGAVGTRLAHAFAERGYPIVSVVNRTGSKAIALAKGVRCKRASTELKDLDRRTEVLIVAVTDTSLDDVARKLAGVPSMRWKNVFVAHTSGSHSSEVFEPLRRKGARVASLHPIQTFPRTGSIAAVRSVKLRGVYYGVDGNDEAIAVASKLVSDLEGHVVVVPSDMRPLYHVACVFASNYLMVYLNSVRELASQLSLTASWTEVFGPLMTSSMENAISSSSGAALTGPIVRRDFATVDRHLKTLARVAPHYLPLYTVNGIETARIARNCGRISQDDLETVVARFRKFIKSTSIKPQSKVRS
jgi:predicted short-subunit dehydrogenase-like oxidoreductase (DUF2520 family)